MVINIEMRTLVENQLTPNEYCYLYLKTFGVPDELKGTITFGVDLIGLAHKGYIQLMQDEEGDPIYEYELTRKGTQIVGGLKAEFTIQREQEVSNVKNWLDEFRKLWPGVSPNGRLLRANRKATQKKLESFIKKHSDSHMVMTKDIIMNASKKYLIGQAKDRYMYTKQCDHFIWKDNEMNSTLRTWIDVCIEDPNSVTGTTDMTDDI
jgi:hypothetical protein